MRRQAKNRCKTKRYQSSRFFGNLEFGVRKLVKTRKDATELAKRLRANDTMVRIIKVKDCNENWFALYGRRKK